MDSLTQIALGAAVGEAVAGNKSGNKALLWGAIAGTIPDLDVLSRSLMETVEYQSFHRGPTHSILFSIAMAPILGWIISKIHPRSEATFKDWTLLSFLALFTHPILDCFTTWGTQLFWPFSDIRIAWQTIFVIDPHYTLPMLVCLVWLMFLSRKSKKRRKLNYIGLSISSLYLLITIIVKGQANQVFEESFHSQNLKVLRYESKPAPFNVILWAVTAEVEDGYYIGYYSFLDDDKAIDYDFFKKNHDLKTRLQHTRKLDKLIDLSNRWFTLEQDKKSLIFNDLRFGQTTGWESNEGNFVFSYRLIEKDNKLKVEEVEKSFGDGRKLISQLWNRITGKE